MSEWRDISTAPCNDVFVLIYWYDGNMSVEDLDHDSDPDWWIKRGAEYWMFLPEPPQE